MYINGVFMFEGVIVCKTQAAKGQYGCEVWINPNVVVGSRGDVKFKVCAECLSILSYKPRSIVVALALGPFACSLVSVHAPDSSSPHFTEWWDSFPKYGMLRLSTPPMCFAVRI